MSVREAGDWDLVETLGQGMQAEVWRAVHRPTGTPGAVKVFASAAPSEVVFEVAQLAALDHPSVARILDRGDRVDGAPRPWIALELADSTLPDRLDSLDWPATRALLDGLLGALAHAHALTIRHRDVKPANVLYSGGRPMLADFGIAWQAYHGEGRPRAAGTPAFSAPEQLAGRWTREGPWTDLYALGSLAWWCVTGDAPYGTAMAALQAHRSAPLPPFRPRFEVPAGLEPWLARLLAKAPRDRFSHAAAARAGLAALDGLPLRPGRDTFDPSFRPRCGRGLLGIRALPVLSTGAVNDAIWSALEDPHPRRLRLRGPAGAGRGAVAIRAAQIASQSGLGWPFRIGDGGLEAVLRDALLLEDGAAETRVVDRLEAIDLADDVDRALYTEAARSLASTGSCAFLAGLARRALLAQADGRPLVAILATDAPDAAAFVESLYAEGAVGVLLSLVDRPDLEEVEIGPIPEAAARAAMLSVAPLAEGLLDELFTAADGYAGRLAESLGRLSREALEFTPDGTLQRADTRGARTFDADEIAALHLATIEPGQSLSGWLDAASTVGLASDTLVRLVENGAVRVQGETVRAAAPVDPTKLPATARARNHAAIASVLPTGSTPRLRLAAHLEASGRAAEALALALPEAWSDREPLREVASADWALERLAPDDERAGACRVIRALARASIHDVDAFEAEAAAFAAWVRDTGHVAWAPSVAYLEAWIALFRGDLEAARASLREALKSGPQPILATRIERSLGQLYVDRGEVGRAARHFEKALVLASTVARKHEAVMQLAWAQGADGDPEAGLTSLAACRPPIDVGSVAWRALLVRGDLHRWAGARFEARVDYRKARAICERLQVPTPLLGLSDALLAWAEGRADDARAHLGTRVESPHVFVRFVARALDLRIDVAAGLPVEAKLDALEAAPVWNPDAMALLGDAAAHTTGAVAERLARLAGYRGRSPER
ncbi:MAG: hypothetical protein H6737_17400 [Alphaproteobacteria bacterium]|nr:hypothetical protein [Alphaproteobacteria bacterium]